MAKMYVIKGHANYNGACQKNFEVVAPLETTQGGQHKIDAVKKLHPDWEAICVDSWKEL